MSIIIPVPDDADTPRFRTNIGAVHYAPETSSVVWKIKQFGGGKEFLMRAELNLPSVRGDDDKGGGMMGGFGGSMGGIGGSKGKRPIQVKFEIPYFTTSGIQVRYLKIIEPKVCQLFIRSVSNTKIARFASTTQRHMLAPRRGFAKRMVVKLGSRPNLCGSTPLGPWRDMRRCLALALCNNLDVTRDLARVGRACGDQAASATGLEPGSAPLPNPYSDLTSATPIFTFADDLVVVAIPVTAMGSVYHTVRRHCCAAA